MRMVTVLTATLVVFVRALVPAPTTPQCDLSQYKALSGLTASTSEGQLVVTWKGARDTEFRARYVIENGQPFVRDLAVHKGGAAWATLGENLKPEYRVVTGVRR